MTRPDKITYYLNIAKQVSKRSTCIRRNFGAIIVKDDIIVTTGYNGAPRDYPNCITTNTCIRELKNIPSGERYELCEAVHAEMNAVINAARAGVSILNGTMYIYGEDVKTGEIFKGDPCKLCKRVIINSGLEKVILADKDNIHIIYTIKDLLNKLHEE